MNNAAFWRELAEELATMGPVGHIPPAPGTYGSAFAVGLAMLATWVIGFYWFSILLLCMFPISLFAIYVATKGDENPDRKEIVVDELVGQWIAVLPVVYGIATSGASVYALWPGWLAAFLLFRLFDIWKPGPVGWADRRRSAFGVLLDDVFAGVLAAIGVIALAAIAHGPNLVFGG